MGVITNKHGGQRPGAGRKAELVEPVRVTVVLEKRHLDWLARHFDNTSAGLRQVINELAKFSERIE